MRYKIYLPNACDQYGSSMGRRDYGKYYNKPIKVHLNHIRLDRGGYDKGGAYWGIGERLYLCAADIDDLEVIYFFFRAKNRYEAKKIVEKTIPLATFYN